ncbi:hypothetical protein NDU88_005042 [Pleurodeles waltl]|uniref:Uncharacterized protein n=1 Tax=Pleurodeles waltl TaxID=8319 RepID=A0AAV7PMJ9_PLEWA|nr:hypothetical protein NDU88_005042 [Pleurodeles waltl]
MGAAPPTPHRQQNTATSPPPASMAVGGSPSVKGQRAANGHNRLSSKPPPLAVFRMAVPRRSWEKTAEVKMTPYVS